MAISWASFAITCCVALLAGCANGLQSRFPRQLDSAWIEGPVSPKQGPEYGNTNIQIKKVDATAVDFDASVGGMLLNSLYPKALYLSPGHHTIGLYLFDTVEQESNGVALGQYLADASPSISIDVLAQHAYRLTANRQGTVFELVLWDETSATGGHRKVQTWTVNGTGGYWPATPPE